MNKSIEKTSEPIQTTTPPPGGGRWFFISRETVDDDGQLKSIRRVFSHKGPSLATLRVSAAEARPAVAPKYADKPRLAAKRWRALQRALRRGRRTQVESALGSYTGT